MHACLRLILLVGVQGSKLSIYTYPTYHSLSDNWKITEKLFTQGVSKVWNGKWTGMWNGMVEWNDVTI